MPTVKELIAYNRSEEEICKLMGADWLIYQDLDDLVAAVKWKTSPVEQFDTSCFSGEYVTGDITAEYLQVAAERAQAMPPNSSGRSSRYPDRRCAECTRERQAGSIP
jgi:amidophosphoribosyltransferase